MRVNKDVMDGSSSDVHQQPSSPRQTGVDLRTMLVPPRASSSSRNGSGMLNRYLLMEN